MVLFASNVKWLMIGDVSRSTVPDPDGAPAAELPSTIAEPSPGVPDPEAQFPGVVQALFPPLPLQMYGARYCTVSAGGVSP